MTFDVEDSVNIVGAIPARYGSTRFPGKSLALICGKPLVQWVYERASQAKTLSQVVIATDDDRIKDAVESFGGIAVMTSVDHPSGTDRIAEAVSGIEADVVINIQGDEPLIDPKLIDRLGAVMEAEPYLDMATAATRIDNETDLHDPSVVKVVWNDVHEALLFSRSVIPFDRDGCYDWTRPVYWRHLGIYAYRKPFLEKVVELPCCDSEKLEKLEQLRALNFGARMKVVEYSGSGVGVDNPEDIEKVEQLMKEQGLVQ